MHSALYSFTTGILAGTLVFAGIVGFVREEDKRQATIMFLAGILIVPMYFMR